LHRDKHGLAGEGSPPSAIVVVTDWPAQRQRFGAIISNMGRGIDRTAGYKLLEELRKAGVDSSCIIYAASTDPKRWADAKRRGALDATNRPDELFQLVLSAIGSRP
jgi:hypothetical protein